MIKENKAVISFFENHYPKKIEALESKLKPIADKLFTLMENPEVSEEELDVFREFQKEVSNFADALTLNLAYLDIQTDQYLSHIGPEYLTKSFKSVRVKAIMGVYIRKNKTYRGSKLFY